MTAQAAITAVGRPMRTTALRMAAVVAAVCAYLALFGPASLPRHFFETQDLYVAALYAAALVAFALGWAPHGRRLGAPALDAKRVAVAAALLALALWASAYLVFGDYPLTRDEHMVVFDAAIYRSGELAAALPPELRALSLAMTPEFQLEVPGQVAWVSNYMPVNAAMRAAFGALLDPALMNPLLVGISALALFSIARRLFPERPGTQAVALLLYFTSAQMLAAAMTPYAMTGHLALNLVWLALFMRGGALGHGGAALVGFAATGLHQIIFHPLFVLPFIEHLRRRGQWRTALFYVAAYGAIGLFWMSYPSQVFAAIGVAASTSAAGGGGIVDYVSDRVMPLILERGNQTLFVMAFNLLRFVTWQNLALIPLLAAAVPLARRGHGIAGPLYVGIVATVAAMWVLLPYQGHGWGYRYVHGLLGSFALLAAYGWERLKAEGEPADRLLAFGTALTVLLAAPFLLWQAYSFARPYARMDAAVTAIAADQVVIDTGRPGFIMDIVRNDPYLRVSPLRFSAYHLRPDDIDLLCRRGRVAFVSGGPSFGNAPDAPTDHLQILAARARERGCLAGSFAL